jgi:hypothetical protein
MISRATNSSSTKSGKIPSRRSIEVHRARNWVKELESEWCNENPSLWESYQKMPFDKKCSMLQDCHRHGFAAYRANGRGDFFSENCLIESQMKAF